MTIRPPLPVAPARSGSPERAAEERTALALLTGGRSRRLLEAALAHDGAHLVHFDVHEVHHRPGAGVSVGYTVTSRQGQTERTDYLLLSTAELTPAAVDRRTSVVVTDGRWRIHAWRHPGDPELPALAAVCDAAQVAHLLAGAGLPVGGDGVELELLAYRPTRRAVLRARAAGKTWYLKVLRPGVARDVAQRHETLTAAGIPVPHVALAHDSGLLVFDELAGEPLAASLARDGAEQLDPHRLTDILDALPRSLTAMPRRPAWSDRVVHHGQAAHAALPEHAGRIATVVDRVVTGSAAGDLGPVVATHGDFYEAQLLVDGARIVGVLDVDTAGPGHRVDDLACLLGHLDVLPDLAPEVYPYVPEAKRRWLAVFDQQVDPATLRVRTAGVVLSLVAGAQTRDEALLRLGRAEVWLDEAAMLGLQAIVGTPEQSERSLIDLSLVSHGPDVN